MATIGIVRASPIKKSSNFLFVAFLRFSAMPSICSMASYPVFLMVSLILSMLVLSELNLTMASLDT